MRIAVDAMGGDHAPDEILDGAVEVAAELGSDDTLVIIGPEQTIREKIAAKQIEKLGIEIVDAPEVIGMDEPPVEALRKKKKSSIAVMAKMAANNEVDAVISAGNTGACVAACQVRMRNLPGVNRPGIAVVFPTFEGPVTICDVGANISCKPINLYQYAAMSSLYSQHAFGITSPRIGLMSIGEEDAKGNEVIKKAREMLRSDEKLNFIGNVEGRDIFTGVCDVVVTDGYVGNVVLKVTEALVDGLFKCIKHELLQRNKLLALSFGSIMKSIYKKYDYHEYGGAPLLGINGTSIICHGSSKCRTIKNAILASRTYHEKKVNELIVDYLEKSSVRPNDEQND
jgi:phosphate acyltransferase